jgi:flavorubredoxin
MKSIEEINNTSIVTNETSGTNITQIANGVYRISTPVPPNPYLPLGFTFNMFLVVGTEASLIFHTNHKRYFQYTKEAVASIIDIQKQLKYVAFSHIEGDECGSLKEWLDAAPDAVACCAEIGVRTTIDDSNGREPRGLKHHEEIDLGGHVMQFQYCPHLPHNWECGYLFDKVTKVLLCGDLWTQGGIPTKAVTDNFDEIRVNVFKDPSYFGFNAKTTPKQLDALANLNPKVLACMHGYSYIGEDCGDRLKELGTVLVDMFE